MLSLGSLRIVAMSAGKLEAGAVLEGAVVLEVPAVAVPSEFWGRI